MEASWEYVVALDFWTFQDCGDKEVGRKFLDILQRFGFNPRKFGDEDPPRHNFEVRSSEDLLKLWAERPGQLIIERLGRMGFQALVHLSNPMPILITFAVHDEYFQREENLGRFLEFSEELYGLTKPFYGEVSHKKDWDDKTVVITPVKIGDRTVKAETHLSPQPTKGIPGIFWANFFGPTFVDFYSKAKLENAPGYSKKELPDGGLLILTSKSPLDYPRPETKKVERDLLEHLGKDTVLDKTAPDRTIRSPYQNHDKKIDPLIAKHSALGSSMSSNLWSCPECGEQNRIAEVSRDRVNSLVSFRCLNCEARWTVHTALLTTSSKRFQK